MDDLKRKKSKVESKKNELLIRLQKNVKKKAKRKTKKKKNFKSINGTSSSVDHLFSQFRKSGVLKELGKSRSKGKPEAEGMFVKGLRSEYITREFLNEVNEARKNEDINKIIDMGRVFLEKERRPRRSLKRVIVGKEDQKPEKSPILLRKTSSDVIQDFEQCPLSPISFVNSFAVQLTEDNSRVDELIIKAVKYKKLDLEEEFEKFSLKYEKTVSAHVFLRLPKEGVLEDALEAFKKLRNKNANREFLGEEFTNDEFLKDVKFLSENSEERMATDENFFENFIRPQKFFISESPTCEKSFIKERPLGNELIMTDVKSENYYHPSFIPFFDNDVEDLAEFHEFEKTTKNMDITTPPIQFYRRNMF